MGVLITRSNLEAELKTRLQIADDSSLYPSSRLTSLIQQANIWATQFFFWDDLFKWVKTSTEAGRNYYKYPANMRTNTIMALQIDGKIYERKNYKDFEKFKINNPNSTDKYFASNGKYYYVTPTPSETGSLNLHIYGCFQVFSPYDLANTNDPTIFSYSTESANEAIVKKGIAIAVENDNPTRSAKEEKEALGTLAVLVEGQKIYKQLDQSLETPLFEVPDFFAQNRATPIGRFNYQPR